MKKVAILLFITSSFVFAQNTYVPDDKFEQALIDLGYDTTLDDSVLTANISGVTGMLNVSNKQIADLTGVEAFTALTELNCQDNQLTSLDVSNNTALTYLHCSGNQLTSLDVSSNTALLEFFCYDNQLTSLDVTANTALTLLRVHDNKLTSLDVSSNTALTYLDCNNNQLTSLDVSLNTALTALFCDSNQLDNLDVSANTALIHLQCNDNQLTSLDVSNNTALEIMNCWGNQLTSLDVSNNTALTNLHCGSNQLTSLDVSANTALTLLNVNYNKLTSLDVSKNTALKFFKCADNQLTSLDVSKNTALETLNCYVNQLTSLDVSANTALTNLDCNSNQLTSLDVSSNTKLTVLQCHYNHQLTNLNMRNGITDELTTFNATKSATTLTCIEVLDPAWATTNWTSANGNIEEGVTFSVICGAEAVTKWHVATTGSDGSGSGTLASPLATIQTGINAASDGDTVLVAPGEYFENIIAKSDKSLISSGGPLQTIINGNNEGMVINGFQNGSRFTVDGFTIKNGNGTDLSGSLAAINFAYCHRINLKNLIITENTAMLPVLMSARDSSVVENVIIVNNSFPGAGNEAGGPVALEIIQGDPDSEVVLKNVTIANNGELDGINIQRQDDNQWSVKLINSVIWTETSSINISDVNKNQTLYVYNSLIRGGESGIFDNNGTGDLNVVWGDGNIDVNPMFVDTANGNYHLKDWSQAIGAGTASGAPTTDIEGNLRPNPAGSNPDMGAFENQYGSPQNAPPVLSEIADVSVNEDESITVTLEAINADNADNDAITFSASSEKSEVKLSMGSSSGKVNFSADENWNGLSKISVEATDGTAFDYGNFTVTFLPVNDKPIITSIASDTTNEETAKSIQVTSSDIDGDELSISATTSDNRVVPSVSGMTLTLTPAKDFVGNALVTVIVNDGSLTDTVSYQFTVLNVNDSPVLSAIKDQRIAEDTEFMAKVVATDVDDTSLSFTGNAGSAGISVAFSGNDLTVKPEANWNGSSVITVYASDGKDMDSTKFNLTVDPMQDTPYNFDWLSIASDSINITQSNLTDTYDLKWNTSNEVDGEIIDYLISASVGQFPAEMIHDTTDTSMTITYQDIIDHWYPNLAMLPRATLKFSVSATDGIDTVNVTGDDRVLFVNRYEYLSTEGEGVPVEFALHENYPNPFNPSTTLRFDLPEMNDVTLTIYNMLGQKVRTFDYQNTSAGYHSVTWNATNDLNQQVGAGVYLYQLQTKDFVKTRKMVLLK